MIFYDHHRSILLPLPFPNPLARGRWVGTRRYLYSSGTTQEKAHASESGTFFAGNLVPKHVIGRELIPMGVRARVCSYAWLGLRLGTQQMARPGEKDPDTKQPLTVSN